MSRPPTPSVPSASPESSPRAIALAAGLIALLTLVAYANSFAGAFVYDDRISITDNASIRQLWPLGPAFSPPAEAGTGGRPFANFTFALSYAFSGLQPWGHHLLNVLTHSLAALTLLGVVRRTLLQPALHARFGADALPLATAISALWAVHPLTTQVVTYLSQRTESLMALFFLLTLYCFIRGAEARPRLWHPLAVAACLLGVMSKEVIATAPLLVLLYDRTFVAGSFASALRSRAKLYAALGATWIPLAWFLLSVRERGVGYHSSTAWFDYALTECHAVLLYLKLSIWPHPLIFDYGVNQPPAISAAAPFAFALAAIIAVTVWALRSRPALGFAGTWFLLILGPTSSVVPIIHQPIAENRPYLPLVAVLAVAVLAVRSFTPRRLTFALCGILVIAATAATHLRNRDYRTALSIWSDTVAKRPENARAHYDVAVILSDAGDLVKAIEHFETAIRLDPQQAHFYNNLAITRLKAGHILDAIAPLERAIALKPDFAAAHSNLAVALFQVGRQSEAIAHAETALRYQPNYPDARRNLDIFLATQRTATPRP